MNTCIKDGCDRPAKARGVCNMHYLRDRTAGRLDELPRYRPQYPRVCTEPDCDRPCIAKGFCTMHYSRSRRTGKAAPPYLSVEERYYYFGWTELESGCWEWAGALNANGYGTFRKGGKVNAAHRVSYTIHVGAIPEGLLVRHKCDNPPCVNPAHLELGTQAQNVEDMVMRRRNRVGERHHLTHLTEEDVREIRSRGVDERNVTLAREFRVCEASIRNIIKRETWKSVS